jgi:hypothetical protein
MSQLTQLDANQVTKTVYNPTTQALSTSAAYVSSTILLSAIPAGTSVNSSAVLFLPYNIMGIVANWSGIDGTTGTFQVEGSNDQTTWINIGSAYTITTGSGSEAFSLSMASDPFEYIRLVYSHSTNTVGSITVTYILRA